jgi:hypothetical protein
MRNVAFIFAALVMALALYSQAPPTAIPHRAVFTSQSQIYKLPAAPATGGAVMVFVNGLLMAPGIDYTLSGATLTFTGQQIGDQPIIQVFYWTLSGG